MTTSRRVAAGLLVASVCAPAGLLGASAPAGATATSESLAVSPSALAAMGAAPPNRYATSFPTIKPGSSADDVRAVQYLLRETGRSTDGNPSYDATTVAAVKSYQSASKLPATGTVNPTTLARLTTNVSSGQNRSATLAVQTLLHKHGYAWQSAGAPQMDTHYGTQTDRQVRAFQLGHGITPGSTVGTFTWQTLFGPKTSGPLYGISQQGTGGASKANCGPASAIALLLELGVSPHGWTGNPDTRGPAVSSFRTTTARVTYSNAYGTESTQLVPAFARLGIATHAGGYDDELAAAKAGRPSLVAGDTEFLPWAPWGHGAYSHYLALLGWNGSQLIVMDPWTGTLHTLTPQQLKSFTSKQVGPKEPGNQLPPSRAGVIVD